MKKKKKISKVERERLDNGLVGVTSAVLLFALFMTVMYNLIVLKGAKIALVIIASLLFVGGVSLLAYSKKKENKKYTQYSLWLLLGAFLSTLPIMLSQQGIYLAFLALAVVLIITYTYYALRVYMVWENNKVRTSFYIISGTLILLFLFYMAYKCLSFYGII